MSYRTTVQCHECGSFVMPRMDIYNGRPVASFCPVCGNMMQDFSPAWAKYIPHAMLAIVLAFAFFNI